LACKEKKKKRKKEKDRQANLSVFGFLCIERD